MVDNKTTLHPAEVRNEIEKIASRLATLRRCL